jgi:hypothetical protein
MKEKIIMVYNFKELPKEIQEDLIKKEQEALYEHVDLSNFQTIVKEELEEKGFHSPEIYYDLSYCQGSGLCFSCKDIDVKKILKDFDKNGETCLNFAPIIDNIRAYIPPPHGSYVHERSTRLETEFIDDISATLENPDIVDQLDKRQLSDIYNYLENLKDELEEMLEDYRIELCKKYKEEGYREIDNQTSEEFAKEILSELEFDEYGNVI